MRRRSRVLRVGEGWLDFRHRFKKELEPVIGRKISDSELSNRIAGLVDEMDIIKMSVRQASRKKKRGIQL